jgi:hypothetical protein
VEGRTICTRAWMNIYMISRAQYNRNKAESLMGVRSRDHENTGTKKPKASTLQAQATGGFEYVSVERRLESGKFRFSWVILGEEVPISVELDIFGFLYLGMHPIPVDIITQNCWRYQRIL